MRIVIKTTLVFVFCAFHFHLLFGQNSPFIGRVVDSQSDLSIPFATIRIKSKMLGVFSNANGYFQIPEKYSNVADSLVISCIGYSTKTVAFEDLHQSAFNLIKLAPSITDLQEVVIKPKRSGGLSASRIVRQAIKNIAVNYPQEPFSYIGYYRDYQMIDTNYLNLNEAIIEVYDRGFGSYDFVETSIELYQFLQNTDFPIDTTTTKPYDNKPAKYGRGENKYIPNGLLSPVGGSELSILRLHDAIRNHDRFSFSYIEVFQKDFENNHFLKLEEDVNLDKVPLYCISFRSKFDASGPINYSEGKLYIEKNSFAIHKMEYSTYNKSMKGDQLMYSIETEYARVGSKMHLNYISFNNGFKTHNDTDFKVIRISYDEAQKAFVLDLNSIPEPISVSDKANFKLTLGDSLLGIQSAQLTGELQVTLILNDESAAYVEKNKPDLSSKLVMKADNVRDLKNRELDESTSTTVFQFRELFVQKVFPGKVAPLDGIFLDKIAPISKGTVSGNLEEKETYWMNSPLKGKQ
jgi:hypothetical protein